MSFPHTSTVKLDLDADRVYGESADEIITNDVHEMTIKRGRGGDLSQASVGTCKMKLINNAGAYTPRNDGSPLYDSFHPMAGVQVASSAPAAANHFTGFIRKITVHPRGKQQYVTVDCADWLWVLSRVDVSLPLMRDVLPGILIHRIVDLAEVGEHCDNPRFRDDLTGYSEVDVSEGAGSATNTRVTTGMVMEGAAALETVATIWAGWRYDIPHDADADFQGLKVTASMYIWTPIAADVGETVRFQLADSVNPLNGIGYTDLVLSMQPQRVEVTATFGGAATDFYIQAYPTSAATFRTGAVHCVSYKSAIPRTFDAGQSRFAYIAPRRVNALAAIREAAENELGGWVYVDGSGTLIFEDRHHRWYGAAHTVSQGTIDEVMADLPYEEDAEDLIGLVELGFAQWVEGAPGTQVWSADRLPIAIGPNGSETVEIDYGAIVRDAIKPVANTDYTINSNPNGGGNDESGNVTLAWQDWGEGGEAVFTNTVARTVYLTSFVVRGTPVREVSDTPQVVYTPSGAPDLASKLQFSYRFQSSRRDTENFAEYLGDRHVTQLERLPVALVNKSSALLTQILARKLSERVTVTADNAAYSPKVNGPYYIDSIEHRFSKGATLLQTKWGVVPVDVDMGIWDSSVWGDGDAWAP